MIQTLHLFRPLNQELISLLRSLAPADWSRPTLAGRWTIKDVASHLLDGSLRTISMYRDGWQIPAPPLANYGELVQYLDELNATWVTATRRLSAGVLVEWLESTHETYVNCLENLDLNATARFSVAWAGESVSTNAFHIAREYTEKWHHQQQMQEALHRSPLLTPAFYHPVLDTFMMALPHAYRAVDSPEGTRVSVHIPEEAGGTWTIEKTGERWRFSESPARSGETTITIPASLAWKLFTKAVSHRQAGNEIKISGSQALAQPALDMVSVMAVR